MFGHFSSLDMTRKIEQTLQKKFHPVLGTYNRSFFISIWIFTKRNLFFKQDIDIQYCVDPTPVLPDFLCFTSLAINNLFLFESKKTCKYHGVLRFINVFVLLKLKWDLNILYQDLLQILELKILFISFLTKRINFLIHNADTTLLKQWNTIANRIIQWAHN